MMKFLVDRTLGKLARRLRVLGYDTLYWGEGNLEEAVGAALSQERILLTRSQRLRQTIAELKFLIIQADDVEGQMQEVLSKLHLRPGWGSFCSRCLLCNEELLAIAKGEVEGKVPDFIYRLYDTFHICPRCRRLYWPGTHFQRMKKDVSKTAPAA